MAAGLRAAVSESALLSDCTRIEYCSVDERVDPVGPKARPVVVAGDDYQHLRVAELALEGRGALDDVDNAVLNAILVQGPVGRVALDAGSLPMTTTAAVVPVAIRRSPRRA